MHSDRTEHLAYAQFHSARRLAHHPDEAALYPRTAPVQRARPAVRTPAPSARSAAAVRHLPRLPIPWGIPLTPIGEDEAQVADAQRRLVRIGRDRPAGTATGPLDVLAAATDTRGYPQRTSAELAGALAEDTRTVVLDVRRDEERAIGGITGSTHVPLHGLLDRLDDVPPSQVWVHCAAGFHASTAASLLAPGRTRRRVHRRRGEHDAEHGLPIA